MDDDTAKYEGVRNSSDSINSSLNYLKYAIINLEAEITKFETKAQFHSSECKRIWTEYTRILKEFQQR